MMLFIAGVAFCLLAELLIIFGVMIYEARGWRPYVPLKRRRKW